MDSGMDTRHLIDLIMQQTTVLIAQLSTAAGVRAPLAHVADRVFLDLSSAIEAQGKSKKVVADMFGLALRGYQKKVARLAGETQRLQKTLSEALIEFVDEQGSVSKSRIRARFAVDGEREVLGVLRDLVDNGTLYRTGRGEGTVYGLTSPSDLKALSAESAAQALENLVWLRLSRGGAMSIPELCSEFRAAPEAMSETVHALLEHGRVHARDGAGRLEYEAGPVHIPVGSSAGWEAALFDHFHAVARALGAKVSRGATRSSSHDLIGGSTLIFEVHPTHPHYAEVTGLLARVREEVHAVWHRVRAHNEAFPSDDRCKTRVTFYFGQNVEPPDTEEEEQSP
jgi:hypothetical protein